MRNVVQHTLHVPIPLGAFWLSILVWLMIQSARESVHYSLHIYGSVHLRIWWREVNTLSCQQSTIQTVTLLNSNSFKKNQADTYELSFITTDVKQTNKILAWWLVSTTSTSVKFDSNQRNLWKMNRNGPNDKSKQRNWLLTLIAANCLQSQLTLVKILYRMLFHRSQRQCFTAQKNILITARR